MVNWFRCCIETKNAPLQMSMYCLEMVHFRKIKSWQTTSKVRQKILKSTICNLTGMLVYPAECQIPKEFLGFTRNGFHCSNDLRGMGLRISKQVPSCHSQRLWCASLWGLSKHTGDSVSSIMWLIEPIPLTFFSKSDQIVAKQKTFSVNIILHL